MSNQDYATYREIKSQTEAWAQAIELTRLCIAAGCREVWAGHFHRMRFDVLSFAGRGSLVPGADRSPGAGCARRANCC